MPLSPLAVRHAKPGPKPIKLSDGGGLYLLIQPNGSRLWRMNYRWLGRQKTLALGAYPAVDLADARKERDRAKGQLARGVDPSQAKIEARVSAKIAAANTFRAIAEEWLEMRSGDPTISAATKVKDRQVLEKWAYPAFGAKPASEVTTLQILTPIRTMEAKGYREVTRKYRSVVRRVFAFAIVTERADRNPASDLTDLLLPREVEHHAGLTDPRKIGRLVLAIRGYDGTPSVRLGLQFLAYTFVRTAEMRQARKEWIDWSNNLMRVPAGFMKRKRDHIVPLAPQVVALLEEMLGHGLPGSLIFPGVRGGDRPMSENTINGALRSLGYAGDVHTGHGFRTTASTILNESGRFHEDWIERQLSHVDENKVRSAYNAALYLQDRAAMMRWYADWLDAQADVASLM